MITSEKEREIIQKCLIIVGLNELRGKFYLQDKKEKGDGMTPRIHKTILELRTLFFDEKDVWGE